MHKPCPAADPGAAIVPDSYSGSQSEPSDLHSWKVTPLVLVFRQSFDTNQHQVEVKIALLKLVRDA